MLNKIDKTFQGELDQNNLELYDKYDDLRHGLIELARERNLDIEYAYENETGRELPEAFSFQGREFSIRDSKLFNALVYGSLDRLKEIFDNPDIYKEYLEEVFGAIDDYIRESQINAELGDERNELEKEAA